MAKDKKFVEDITPMDEDFAQWYTDIVKKAELADYSSIRGCMIIRPNGYAIWENIQKYVDTKLKEYGHENVSMPIFIPENLLQKEKDHVEGFAPEVAWVTHGGDDELAERLCVRPTSETLFCEHYAKIVQSYKDLPKLYNQWCSVVRWEKTTRPFLRTTEFLWQEGHTIHETKEEAESHSLKILNMYSRLCEDMLAMPVVMGKKTDKEKFAGADDTYTIESLMHDGKALQAGTSHYLGQNFSKAFAIQFSDRNGKLDYPHYTTWAVTTRLIGAIIMVHGDNSGLKLPPRIAPTQAVIIPVAQHKEGVLEKAEELKERLAKVVRVKLDDSDKMPGWKYSEYEMKGIPLRIEIGPKDIEKNQAVLVRRDNREKTIVSLDEIEIKVQEMLDIIHNSMLEEAKKTRDEKTYVATNMEEFEDTIENKPGFIKAMWCGDKACEDKIREVTGATSRCMPFEQEVVSDTCVCCGKKAKNLVYWGRAY
ncbi:proline--tRNA ligase [Clostridium botulinum]|uniref:Proline--tRNA ligase n=1 Tax=Clostridium botulinum (strain Okra / Type B1) TaxID=498213 RepID=SYP_CLOBK|nr:proline--tRNA ligase [Clostridium botulinum]B1IFI2.1 RecName: Full=Proline--tRNA ligase; AltName: Full=Prolyl-tRNA synthetase; Short=ProRS [Clostridium botulinum B1 str. Okra]EKX78897.1 prolyl-tRNA ligase [Clostridium botulinum CFSAN001628]ACA44448.1 prolyl-tRNA synthetase [Clostridium botulinum B1 str. Okra]MBD5561262.1 proline--tRNA ligase [Clostridium botulinum]MBD5567438.1 proline--tRNA ligase [Clostridium botulinum]MBD5571486.1 proline--tRNA ligase [Clostridium botulinum]